MSQIPLIPLGKLYLLDAKFPGPDEHEIYRDLYNFWQEIWNSTFLELEGKSLLTSDDFLRQDEILAFVANNKVVGSVSMHWFDLRFESHRQHSYFKTYPEEVISKLRDMQIKTAMSMGQLAVAPEWRKSNAGPLVSEVLFGAACKRFLESDSDAIITYTRNNRKTNDLCYRHGAKCLLANHRAHNVEVDIVTITRQDVRESSLPGIPTQLERIWQARVESIAPQRHLDLKAGQAA